MTKIFLKEFVTIKIKTQRLKRYPPMYYQIHSQNLLNTVFQTFLSYYFCLAPYLDVVSNKLLNGSEFQSKPMFSEP